MNRKIILECLEGGRARRVFELIKKVLIALYKDEERAKQDMEEIKEKYLEEEEGINDKNFRYLLVEHYNIPEGFYFRAYEENNTSKEMYNDYFYEEGDTQDSYGEILLVDMKENKCFLIDKEVKYTKTEIKRDG
jgi:hypothetical protein